MKLDRDLAFDRRLSEEFLQHFLPSGFAAGLAAYVKAGLYPLDLRPRRDLKSKAEHVTLYVGLTAVLQVKSSSSGLIRLDAHKSHRKIGGFSDAWAKPHPVEDWIDQWPDVEAYLERIIPAATQSHGRTEGAVQAAVGAHRSQDRVVLDREVTPSFRDESTKKRILEECRQPVLKACRDGGLGFGKGPKTLGSECDALAVDRNGRILAIEIKPLGGSIPWVPAQALMYARVLQRWVEEDPAGAAEVLRGMGDQRHRMGLAPAWAGEIETRPEVVPVVAVQRGASAEAVRRMVAVRDALRAGDVGGPEVELHEVSLIGDLIPLEESRLPSGRPRAVGASYAARENDRNIAWKQTTSTLPDEARHDDKAPYYLPRRFAKNNLLPEVRETALSLFKDVGIPWHQGTDGGPTRHLRSSQVQCANALGQMVTDPARIVAAFGSALDIAEVRDFGDIDPSEQGRYLTFEFNGAKDYLNESRRLRGAQTTSVDAAFAYRTTDGRNALALVEWKYTETYPAADRKAEAKLKERTRRYGDLLDADKSPIDLEGVELADLFHEPIYQLVRQQLLAARIEEDPDAAAELVRVVHLLSPRNEAYQRSYIAPGLRSRGPDVGTVWQSLLRSPDRFVKLDPQVFLDPDVTSSEYVARYGSAGGSGVG